MTNPADTSSSVAMTCRPLQALPATPLNKRPVPIRISSSPPKTQSTRMGWQHSGGADVLTPPTTPPRPQNRRLPASADILGFDALKIRASSATVTTEDAETVEEPKQITWAATSPKPYASKYRPLGSNTAGREEYGRGVWSVVYRAIETVDSSPSPGILTPPTSPAHNSKAGHPTSILAIKAPTRRDANKVLKEEARILTYIHRAPIAADHVVAFYGYDETTHALVLDAVPLSLDAKTKSAVKDARNNFSTRTMFDPVIGSSQWSELAEGLIGGLAYLHSRGCVHGDIKPANVLLQPTGQGSFRPLYCDFSSSHILDPESPGIEIEEVGAVTTDFTAPELLQSFYRRNGQRAVATFASDVFALAVTLLVAATGESPYAGARMEIQKVGMAKEGKPLEFARAGDQASRIMKGKIVDRVVKGALERDPSKRIRAEDWRLQLVEIFAQERL